MKGFSLTVDGYWVQIKDRIVLTGAFYFAKVGLKF
jgi:hypothetical protein